MILDDITIAGLGVIILMLTLSLLALLSRRRKTPFTLRHIAAYDNLPAVVGQAIEADRPLHISLGSAALGGESTLAALAGAQIAYLMARKAAIGDKVSLVTVAEAGALPLAQDALRHAYTSRGMLARYRARNARWYPAGARSLAFAAAITAMMADERVAGNVFAGSYGPELALMMAASHRRDTPAIAVSDQLTGQAVAYVFSDSPLIGEEMFVSTPYLDQGRRANEAVVIDLLRWLLVLAMLGGLIARIAAKGG